MPLYRAISTLGCPDLSLLEAISLTKQHGLSAIEIRCLGNTLDIPAYFAAQFGSPGKVARLLAEKEISVVSLDTSFSLIGHNTAQREELVRFAEWAEALAIPSLRVFDGGRGGSDAELREAADSFAWWRSLRAQKGWKVDIVVETHDLLFTTPLILRFCELAPGAAILWDTHHTWRQGLESPVDTWVAIRNFVRHIHVKDSVLQPGPKLPYTYVLPGDGEFPMTELRERFIRDDCRHPVSLEWEKRWIPELPSLDEALARADARHWW